MTTIPIYDRTGAEVGTYEIDPAELAPRINKQLLHDAAVMYQANQRQGTARSKTRGEVAGSTKKMYRQKGTGNARAGHRRSGVRRGGGHIHAVRNRDYSYRLPRKALRAATRMAIAAKIRSGGLVVIDQLVFDAPRTKEMFGILKALKLSEQSTLVTTDGYDANVYKSARNIARVTISPVAELNVLNVLQPKRMLVTKAALDTLRQKAAS
ncbi:MAG: 50S ribosomal protein L4 [Pirellulaceae bacterium]|nr:50S ribosomal protein L4 [Pirellulaceae bacterium]